MCVRVVLSGLVCVCLFVCVCLCVCARAGLWIGEYGSHGYELLYLSSHQDAATIMTKQTDGSPLILRVGQPNLPSIDLVGLKVTGDPNVPSGQATFCVTGHGAKRRHRCTCRY
jgi:hypothetical protein